MIEMTGLRAGHFISGSTFIRLTYYTGHQPISQTSIKIPIFILHPYHI